jgi:alpha-N-arabinofuranosidase
VELNGVHPFLFGHFVEDIDDHLPAMLAYPIRNMDFEEHDDNRDGVSGCWYPIHSGKHTSYAVEPAARFHSGHSQKIRLFNKDRVSAGIGQKVQLDGGIDYSIRLYARATREIRSVEIIVADLATGRILGSTEIAMEGHDWKEYTGIVRPSMSCGKAELRIMAVPEPFSRWQDSVSTGMIWFDHISMLPGSHQALLKEGVYELAAGLKPSMLRLGGNYISVYHWQDYVGPDYFRPSAVNEAWELAGFACKYFGTDEYIALCRKLGAEPLICVNVGTGTPEEAARWVEYCNGDASTPMGTLRAANGYPEPYGVKYWEVGNEMYGPWQSGNCTAEQYAASYLQFAAKMKETDSSIKLLAIGTARDALTPGWNKTVLELVGAETDYLTMHIYQGQNFFSIDAATPSPERFKAIMAFPELVRHVTGEVAALKRERPELHRLKLAITEWNTMYFPNPDMPNGHSLEAAAANACFLNELIRSGGLIEIATFSDLVNGWVGGCIRVGDSYERMKRPGWSGREHVIFGTATYHMLRMYANRDIAHTVDCQVTCGTFRVDSCKLDLALEELPELDVAVCMNGRKDKLTVFAVNRSLSEKEVNLHFDSFACAEEAAIYSVTSGQYEDCNTVFEPELIHMASEKAAVKDRQLVYRMNASSVYVFEIEGGFAGK